MMQKNNSSWFWIVLIVILVIVNISTLSFFWLGRNNIKNQHPLFGKGGAEGYIISELKFDSTQQAAFFVLKNQHHKSIHETKEQIKIAKESFFNLLKDTSTSESTIMSAAERISQLEKEIEIKTFHHFQQLRVICNADQKIKFDNIINHVVKMNAPMQGPPHRNGEMHNAGNEFSPHPPNDGQMPPSDGNPPPLGDEYPFPPREK